MSQSPPPPLPATASRSGACTTSLVLGLAGFVCCGVGSIMAIIFGHVGLSRTKSNPQMSGAGLARMGLVLGYLQVTLLIGGILAVRDSGTFLWMFEQLGKVIRPAPPTERYPDLASAPFALILPDGYTPGTPLPCVFWLHGYGSVGTDVFAGRVEHFRNIANRENVAFVGISAGRRIIAGEDKGGYMWAESADEDQAHLEAVMQLNAARITPDWSRSVLFGFSQGGKLAGLLAASYPEKYRAAMLFSPGGFYGVSIVPDGANLKGSKMLCVCMEKEAAATVVTTRHYARELEKAGAAVAVSIYPGIDRHQTPPDFDSQLESWIHQLRAADSN